MVVMMCISRSEVCSRFLAVWWCPPKRIQKYRIPKYGLSEEAQAPKEPSSSSSSNSSGDQSCSFYFYFLFFYFFFFYFFFFDRKEFRLGM